MSLPPSSNPRDLPNAGALDRARAHIMAVSLKALLDQVRGSRDALPHLAALEASLRGGGLESLERISLPALSRICSQLASLPVADHDAPLQDLQTRLLRTMERHRQPAQIAEAPSPCPPPTAASLPHPAQAAPPNPEPVVESLGGAVVVCELTHSAFMLAIQDPRSKLPTALPSSFGAYAQPR